jgi:cell fate regulator YaaT (PSP1 superfamily)
MEGGAEMKLIEYTITISVSKDKIYFYTTGEGITLRDMIGVLEVVKSELVADTKRINEEQESINIETV